MTHTIHVSDDVVEIVKKIIDDYFPIQDEEGRALKAPMNVLGLLHAIDGITPFGVMAALVVLNQQRYIDMIDCFIDKRGE